MSTPIKSLAGERTHVCPECGNEFTNSSTVTQCSNCGKNFSTPVRTQLEGYEPNESGLTVFNSIHNRKAFRLYADKDGNWYVVYMPMHGIHASYGFGSEENRLVRSAITGRNIK